MAYPSPNQSLGSSRRTRAGRMRASGWRPNRQPEAYLFLLPSLAGFLLFTALPVLGALALSFVQWNLLSPPQFIGIGNYLELFRDPTFRTVFINTLFFTVTIVPLQLMFGLLLAVALNRSLRGITVYRVIYFMPVVTPIVAAALIFQWLLNRDFGLISAAIYRFNDLTGLVLTPPDWLNSPAGAKWAIVMLTVWKNAGFTMVIYLAALQGVPTELYDAAAVDGASTWQRFRNVTLPMISPTTFFLLVIQMIGAFQLFSEAYVLSNGQGGPGQATTTIVFYIWQNAFQFGRMGKASAIAWVLFAFIFVCTIVQTRLQRRWVYYEAAEA